MVVVVVVVVVLCVHRSYFWHTTLLNWAGLGEVGWDIGCVRVLLCSFLTRSNEENRDTRET